MPATTVVFDYFGTLTPSTPDGVWQQMAARSAAPLGITGRQWRAALDASWAERVTGSLGDLRATFVELARRIGISPAPEALTAACAARLADQRKLFGLRPEVPGVLTRLRGAGSRLGVLSDCTVELSEDWAGLPVAGLVDARVLSCEEGRRKPDPELFALIARRLGVAPEECLYVGDGGGNELTGASGCGMRAVMLRAPDWPENFAHSREDGWAGEAVTSLTEVAGLLRR